MPQSARSLLLTLAIALIAITPALANGAHPLDGLTAEEIAVVQKTLAAEGLLAEGSNLISVSLIEPDKKDVLAWTPGKALPRHARALLRSKGETVSLHVDLRSGEATGRETIDVGQPPVSLGEFVGVTAAVAEHAGFQEALGKRGVTDFGALFCAPRTIGNFGEAMERENRVLKVDCFDMSQNPDNAFASPIENLFAVVDLDAMDVVEVVDLGVVPIPPGTFRLAATSEANPRKRKPVVINSPEGHNFTLDGSFVNWENWRFHLRFDHRDGLVLSQVSYRDGGEQRSVLYQGHLSELFVPYQDPTEGWYFRNYMDQGEYGLGVMSNPLVKGADCPAEAEYLSPVLAAPDGSAMVLDNAICIFERATGEPTWRHKDSTPTVDSRADVQLIARTIATVGNYDYAFDWVFDAKGRVTFRAGATGLDAVKGVPSQDLSSETIAADTAYGPLIAPGRAGINHDHFFSLRLDMDVDGTANRLVRDRLVAESQHPSGPRRSIWRTHREVAQTETEAQYRFSYETPALFRVESTGKKNSLGYATSYALVPGGNALPLVDESDPALQRALFATKHLWVTPYAKNERYAAGEQPNQSEPGEGLPAWVEAGRSINGEDLVLWYTMGFHHVPSAEDWPVYNMGWHEVAVRPYNFFGENPAMDLE
ncbi:MAG: tyramine oxidase [Acidobacteriota bacterium]